MKAITTKAIRKIFVNHIFEVPTATQRLIDNGLPPDRINDYFNLAFSSTKETKLIMFQYKILHDIVFPKEKLFRAKILLLAKYYIYCCSITEEPLLLSVYLTIVVNKAEIEKQIAVSVNSPEYYYSGAPRARVDVAP